MKQAEQPQIIFFPLRNSKKEIQKIDFSRIVVEPPFTNSFAKEGMTIDMTTSKVFYLNPEGKKVKMYWEMPEQRVMGIRATYPLMSKEDNPPINGYQVDYPLTSYENVKNPSEDEIEGRNRLDSCHNTALKFMGEFCKTKKLTGSARNSYIAYSSEDEKDRNPFDAIKRVYEQQKSEHPKTKEKFVDEKKPLVAYTKLITQTRNKQLKCYTIITGPGNRPVSVEKYLYRKENDSNLGLCKPVFHWESIYWGSHKDKPYGGSLKIFISEMNYSPVRDEMTFVPRLLSANDTEPLEDSDEDKLDETKYSGFPGSQNQIQKGEINTTDFQTTESDNKEPEPEQKSPQTTVPETTASEISKKQPKGRSGKPKSS